MTIVYKSSLRHPIGTVGRVRRGVTKPFQTLHLVKLFQYQKFKMIQPLVDIPGAVLFDLTPQRPHVFRLYGCRASMMLVFLLVRLQIYQ